MNDPLHEVSKVISPDVRVALYHRLHWLWPLLARRAVRRGVRLLGWGLLFAWLAFAALVLSYGGRYLATAGMAVAFDLAMVALFVTYLLRTRQQ